MSSRPGNDSRLWPYGQTFLSQSSAAAPASSSALDRVWELPAAYLVAAGPKVTISAGDVRDGCLQNPVSLVTEGSRQFTTLSTRGSARDLNRLVTSLATWRFQCPAPRPLSAV